MAISKRRGCAFFTLGAFLVLAGTCYVAVAKATTVRVQAYKPAEAVARADREELRVRCSVFEFEQASLCMEWFTYDNDTINQPPYKLVIDVLPKTSELKRVLVEEIIVSSSAGRRYSFADSIPWPIEMALRPAHAGWRTLEPAMRFDFDGGEEIWTRVRLRFVLASGEKTVTVRTRWVPVVVKYFSPIV